MFLPFYCLFNIQVQIKLNPEKQTTVYMAFLTLNDLINQILKLYLIHVFLSVSCIMGTTSLPRAEQPGHRLDHPPPSSTWVEYG